MSPLSFLAVSNAWWPSIGAPLANHVWQSTLFAGAAGFLTLLLRINHARTRHFLWLLASVKFLIPFSLMVAIGTHLGWSPTSPSTQPELLLLMQDFGQPFATASPVHPLPQASVSAMALATRALPVFLLLVWLCGFLGVLFYWWSRSRRMSAAIRGVFPSSSGREWETLRYLEPVTGISTPVDLIVSNSALEPGILGIFRPVLLLPSGISDRLSDTQLHAILSHELCHVRRRDNLAAALHMLVEALFWFHPLVWWLGARLVDERERACDEEVLRLGSDPQTYAESILKICEFYLESPLLCTAGVTGSNLKKRIEVIMHNRAPRNLDFARKLLLAFAGFLSLAIPFAFGLLHARQTRAQSESQNPVVANAVFESVYLRPNTTGDPMPPFVVYGRPMQAMQLGPDHLMTTNFSLHDLMKTAFGVQDDQIVGGPDWLNSEKYDVNAKYNRSEIDKLQKLSKEGSNAERRNLLQALLADQFKLVVHRETRQIPAYALFISQSGSKMQPAKAGDTYANGMKGGGGRPLGPGTILFPKTGEIVGQGIPIALLIGTLAEKKLGRPIVDKTGLSGNYDFTLDWTPDAASTTPNQAIFAAVEQQLGLKLSPQEIPVELIVVDSAEKASPSAALPPAQNPAPPKSDSAAQPGRKVELGDLKIQGTVHDPDAVRDRILKAWNGREYDDAQKLLNDVQQSGVRKDLQDRGYFRAVVEPVYFRIVADDSTSAPPAVAGRSRIFVTVSVAEGAQYRLGTFAVQNSEPDQSLSISPVTLREQFHLHTGDLFKVSELREGLEKSIELYRAKGYADASAQPATNINEAQHLINVTLRFTEGKRSS